MRALLSTPQRVQERQHLQRLSQPHVVGEARAKAQAGHETQPRVAGDLIGAQLRLDGSGDLGRFYLAGTTEVPHDRRKPLAVREDDLLLVRIRPVHTALQPHGVKEGQFAPVLVHSVQKFLQAFPVNLNPFPLDLGKAGGLVQNPLDVLFRQGNAVNGQFRLHGHDGVKAGQGLGLLAELHGEPDGGGSAFPPVRDSAKDAVFLQGRHGLQYLVSLLGGEAQGVQHLAALHKAAKQRGDVRGTVQTPQKLQELLLVVPKLRQRVGQRHMADMATLVRGVGGKEREGVIRALPVLHKMKEHPFRNLQILAFPGDIRGDRAVAGGYLSSKNI